MTFAHQNGELPRFPERGVGAFLLDERRNTTTFVKRQDGGGVPVPNPPGSIFCPATNDEINTSGNMSDSDPYDDRKYSSFTPGLWLLTVPHLRSGPEHPGRCCVQA
jgi:hypothetical protein